MRKQYRFNAVPEGEAVHTTQLSREGQYPISTLQTIATGETEFQTVRIDRVYKGGPQVRLLGSAPDAEAAAQAHRQWAFHYQRGQHSYSDVADSGKFTIYIPSSGFGNVLRIEAKSVLLLQDDYAQYSHALYIRYQKRNARKQVSGHHLTEAPILVVRGWGHPAPDSVMVPTGEKLADESVSVSRHELFSDKWGKDFVRDMTEYLKNRDPDTIYFNGLHFDAHELTDGNQPL